ncbi:DUF4214 domain-containing protein [Mameliella alba]|nr:DUF4214 domain-containing protein [Mameliella alba]
MAELDSMPSNSDLHRVTNQDLVDQLDRAIAFGFQNDAMGQQMEAWHSYTIGLVSAGLGIVSGAGAVTAAARGLISPKTLTYNVGAIGVTELAVNQATDLTDVAHNTYTITAPQGWAADLIDLRRALELARATGNYTDDGLKKALEKARETYPYQNEYSGLPGDDLLDMIEKEIQSGIAGRQSTTLPLANGPLSFPEDIASPPGYTPLGDTSFVPPGGFTWGNTLDNLDPSLPPPPMLGLDMGETVPTEVESPYGVDNGEDSNHSSDAPEHAGGGPAGGNSGYAGGSGQEGYETAPTTGNSNFHSSGGSWTQTQDGPSGIGTPEPGMPEDPDYTGVQPILLDLNGNGIEITEFSQSTTFLDSNGDGLKNRTSWAAPGDGVLFFDADGDGAISEALEFIFTEWDPTAPTDIAALKAVFDTDDDGDIDANDPATWDVNGDGVVNASDKPFDYFKVLVTNEDGSQEAKSLAQLGIKSLNLNEDATNIELPDGSVITGKASFSYSGGGTGTLGDVTLVADGQSYRVTRSDTVANGERTVVQTGYDGSGAVAFVYTAVSALDGTEVTNFYDDNGDGVVDRVQTIEIATTVGVETERKVTNYIGSDDATGVLVNKTTTTRSVDGSSVTIQRDTEGGGWIDQEETRVLQANGAWHITIKDLAEDGSTIRKTFETLTASGQQRTDRVDLDGDGDWDVTTTQTHSATQDPRTETFVVTNTDGSIRKSHTEVTSLDGTDRTVSRDIDGDGVADVEEVTDLTILADGSTQTIYEVLNGDGSLRHASTITQSDDALITTTVSDLDGDGDTDLTTHDATVLNADGSRMQTVTKTNTDGSVRSKVRVELDADQVGMTRKVDLAQDGVFDATDLIDEVVEDAVTLERVASHWDRNPDGSIRATSVETTSEDGLSKTTELDSDGDGDLDLIVTDVTTLNANGTTTRIVTHTSHNDDLLGADTIVSSADGLDVTTSSDLDGDGLADQVRSVTFSNNPDGSRLEAEQLFAGDGTTLLYSHTVLESADRLNALTTIDADGDGNTDETRQKVIASDGSSVTTVTRFAPDGTTIDVTRIETSANGLVSTTSVDLDGDSFDDRIQLSSTVLQDDGSTILTKEIQNRDGSTRSLTVLETSDDGLETALDLDADGDGVFERSTETQTDLLSDGSTSTLATTKAADGTVLGKIRTDVSDDGLEREVSRDSDGDGVFDLVETSTTILRHDGGTVDRFEVTDREGDLRRFTQVIASDNGRSVVTESDLDGDGDWDLRTDYAIAMDGTVTETTEALNANGSLQSRTRLETSDTGLVQTSRLDRDGDLAYETVVRTQTVLGADGSQVTTTNYKGTNGTIYRRDTLDVSGDGREVVETYDLDFDSDADLTVTTTTDLAQDGTETVTVEERAANTDLLAGSTSVTSADGRTSTLSRDADGDGFDDSVTVISEADDGTITKAATYFQGESLLGTRTATISADGFTTTLDVDTNGDGLADYAMRDITSLAASGVTRRDVTHLDARFEVIASATYLTSTNGMAVSGRIDLDGDSVSDFLTRDETIFAEDGATLRVQTTRDASSALLTEITNYTSGDGLYTTVSTDSDGDGIANRIFSRQDGASGGYVETLQRYAAGYVLTFESIKIVSDDGLETSLAIDLDGDGVLDREVESSLDANQALTTQYRDIGAGGSVDAEITRVEDANGMFRQTVLDLDADGIGDIERSMDTSFEADGARKLVIQEMIGAQLTYESTEITAADGLSSVRSIDMDGDGDIDGSETSTTTLHDDGRRTILREVTYANGDQRSRSVTEISADGRTVQRTLDYDGNGLPDKTIETQVFADGKEITTTRTFDEFGAETSRFVETLDADGLVMIEHRGDLVQTTRYVPDGSGSYSWDNGGDVANAQINISTHHEVDPFGVEHWTLVISSPGTPEPWLTYTHGYISELLDLAAPDPEVETYSTSLDQKTKAAIIAEAERLYDTILDRDLDAYELETLVYYIADGQLDAEQLASDLMASGEFTARYGEELTDAEFITQVFLNSYGRAPSLDELDTYLQALSNFDTNEEEEEPSLPTEDLEDPITIAGMSRQDLVHHIADSSEHIVVGNSHRITNNFDVVMNPAEFERVLDRTYVEALVTNLVDVIYDRAPSTQELAELTDRLMNGPADPEGTPETLEDLALELLALDGDVHGVETAGLGGLTNAQLVTQAYWNGLGRAPTAAEQALWEGHLDSGRISKAQFAVSLAQSADHLATGNAHIAPASATVTQQSGGEGAQSLAGTTGQDSLDGGAGDDTLVGNNGADLLIGGGGSDVLNGGNGSDLYRWAPGDGNDTISDGGQSLLEADRLELAQVLPGQVTLTRPSGTKDLVISIDTGQGIETITVTNRFQDATHGKGIEEILFSNGTVWSLDDILAATSSEPSAQGGNVGGTDYDDNLVGDSGAQKLTGDLGDDTLTGGLGDDTLDGGEGSDIYRWAKGDGNDTISEDTTKLIPDPEYPLGPEIEVDIADASDWLELADVGPEDVAMRQVGDDLKIYISPPGESTETITVKNFFAGSTQGATNSLSGILFPDGTTWSQAQIFELASVYGNANANTLTSGGRDDLLEGLAGADTLQSGAGDDTLIGGEDSDLLQGGNGHDSYVWSRGDGDDTISDSGTSLVEIDTLLLEDVSRGDVTLTRIPGSDDLTVTIAGPDGGTLLVKNRFEHTDEFRGIEVIEFGDGARLELDDILALTETRGDATSEALNGTGYSDNLLGLGGNDTINAGSGDDIVEGGTGNDSLLGGNGNDAYVWSPGDGSDTINDSGPAGETDALHLNGVGLDELTLSRSGDDILVTISGSGEVITIKDRLASASTGKGVERIFLEDGTVLDVLDDDAAQEISIGTNAADTLSGTGVDDFIDGLDGTDVLNGNGGDDTIDGGLHQDTLDGGSGSDTYLWAFWDGNDQIVDTGSDTTEIDRLVLTDVMPGDVELIREAASNDLKILVTQFGLTSTITVTDRFAQANLGLGIEEIAFQDGSVWNLDQILANTSLTGTAGADTLSGTELRDVIDGGAGDDSLLGGAENDTLIGGAGSDTLVGQAGSDTYRWLDGDGADLVHDGGSASDADILALGDVAPGEVSLIRDPNSNNLTVRIVTSSGLTDIEIWDQFRNPTDGRGIEAITFDNGQTWTLEQIQDRARLFGTSNDDVIDGTAYRDYILGLEGADTLDGGDGNDTLDGGAGADSLVGRDGSDTYVWRRGDGNDTITDSGLPVADADVLWLEEIALGELALQLGTDPDDMEVVVDGGSFAETILIRNQYDGSETRGIEALIYGDGTIWTRENFTGVSRTGAENAEHLDGTEGNDTLNGLLGADSLYGLGGADILVGGAGDDLVDGGDGADLLGGGAGQDWLLGRAGNDTLFGADGADTLDGGEGNDSLYGDAGADALDGGAADDTLFGGDGADTVEGGGGADVVDGGAGDDRLLGQTGNDTLYGQGGSDTLLGHGGNDLLYSEVWNYKTDPVAIEFVQYYGAAMARDPDQAGHLNWVNQVVNGSLSMKAAAEQFLASPEFQAQGTMTDEEFVTHLYVNGLGRQPDPTGLSTWTTHLANGTKTRAEVVVGIALSAEADGYWADAALFFTDAGYQAAYTDDLFRLYTALVSGDPSTIDLDTYLGETLDLAQGKSFGELVAEYVASSAFQSSYGALGNQAFVEAMYSEILGRSGTSQEILDGTTALDNGQTRAEFVEAMVQSDEFVAATGTDVYNWVRSNSFDDILDSGSGDDTVFGGILMDRYVIRAGDSGTDTIVGLEDWDQLVFADFGFTTAAQVRALLTQQGENVVFASGGVTIVFLRKQLSDFNDDSMFVFTVSPAFDPDWRDNGQGYFKVDGSAGNDSLYGHVEQDILFGLGGNDELNGSEGNDILFGGDGVDTLYGDEGHDILIGGAGSDQLRGGTGIDVAQYTDAPSGLTIDLANTALNTGYAAGDSYFGIEEIRGSAYSDSLSGDMTDDTLHGDAGADTLDGRDGNDSLTGGAGNDVLTGGAGADTLDGGDGLDFALYYAADSAFVADLQISANNTGSAAGDVYISVENLTGGNGDDTLRGDTGSNLIQGRGGHDQIHGRSGNDSLDGGTGDDVLWGGAGADTLNGGDGTDRAQYYTTDSGLVADLATPGNNSGAAAGDIYIDIENLHGGGGDDTLYGDDAENVLWGGLGHDEIQGRAGDDLLSGMDGNDSLIGGQGADTLNGGDGVDRAQYNTATTAVRADLASPGVNTGEAAGDSYISIENLHGGNFSDILSGDGSANTIWGGGGDDTISGRGGDDILIGHSGADTFRFTSGWDHDQINDFEDDVDEILLFNMGYATVQDALADASQQGSDVVFDFGNGDTLTILNVTLADLQDDILLQ